MLQSGLQEPNLHSEGVATGQRKVSFVFGCIYAHGFFSVRWDFICYISELNNQNNMPLSVVVLETSNAFIVDSDPLHVGPERL